MSRVEAFGRWPSPLAPAMVAASRRSMSGLASDGVHLYWSESRPEEGGRQVVVRSTLDGALELVTPPEVSVRSRVHEYGGGAFCLVPGRAGPGPREEQAVCAYVDQNSQQVHVLVPGRDPVALGSPALGGAEVRHGDLRATPDGRWVLATRERLGGGTVERDLVALPVPDGPADAREPCVLCSGRDFLVAPRVDRSGRWLAWICWDHPDMSWDASELWVGQLIEDGGSLGVHRERLVAGGQDAGGREAGGREAGGREDGVSVGQPLWCDDGTLVYVSDSAGWWQPWRWRPGSPSERLCDDEADFHGPDWQLGQCTMAELGDGTIACRRRSSGFDRIGVLDPATGRCTPLRARSVSVGAVCAHAGGVAWLGATVDRPVEPWWAPLGEPDASGPSRPVLGEGSAMLAATSVSSARHFSFTGRRGTPVHGLYYRPRLGGVRGAPGRRPPLVVTCHGGPTGAAEAGFDPGVQLFTTRGFAVVAVDYTGSTGYGRDYRQGLLGAWGVADVDDCVDAALHAVARGWADQGHMFIRGSSAGGLTALGALVRSEVFLGAVSWYGVTDLLSLAAVTHDFESRYTERLVGVPATEVDEYRRRSPAFRVEDMTGSVLVLQGLEDPVVPPSQSEALVTALRSRGRPCRLVTFDGEGHGFRRAATIQAAIEAELAFIDGLLDGSTAGSPARVPSRASDGTPTGS